MIFFLNPPIQSQHKSVHDHQFALEKCRSQYEKEIEKSAAGKKLWLKQNVKLRLFPLYFSLFKTEKGPYRVPVAASLYFRISATRRMGLAMVLVKNMTFVFYAHPH